MTNKDDNKRVIQLPEPPEGYRWSDEPQRVYRGDCFYSWKDKNIQASCEDKYWTELRYVLEKTPEKVKTLIFWREKVGGGNEGLHGVVFYKNDEFTLTVKMENGKEYNYPLTNIVRYWFEERN